MWTALLVIGGLVLLTVGAEVLVASAVGLARRLRVSSVATGLVLVAWGTSAPELATSADAALDGVDAVALGNVAGSNLFNIGAVLALCAAVVPLRVARGVALRDAPLALLASLVVLLASRDGVVSRADGVVLLVLLVAYTAWVLLEARQVAEDEGGDGPRPAVGRSLVGTVVGLVLLAAGARGLVEGSVAVAGALGVDPRVVAVTVVAAGTSLPELFASLAATRRGEVDLAVGNVVGSNLFNLLGVVGVAAVLAPAGLTVAADAARVDLLLATALAAVLVPVLWTGLRVSRLEAAGLGSFYLGYLTWLAATA